MAERIQLEVITPERSILAETVDFVSVPGAGGELGILPGHTPLISQLQTGVLSYTQGATTERLLVSGGFVEVSGDRVSVLADMAERAEEIDANTARQMCEQAERSLATFTGEEGDFDRACNELARAAARLQLAESNSPRS
jgi:F-type H+-transporting ATPase subunit epsilon